MIVTQYIYIYIHFMLHINVFALQIMCYLYQQIMIKNCRYLGTFLNQTCILYHCVIKKMFKEFLAFLTSPYIFSFYNLEQIGK